MGHILMDTIHHEEKSPQLEFRIHPGFRDILRNYNEAAVLWLLIYRSVVHLKEGCSPEDTVTFYYSLDRIVNDFGFDWISKRTVNTVLNELRIAGWITTRCKYGDKGVRTGLTFTIHLRKLMEELHRRGHSTYWYSVRCTDLFRHYGLSYSEPTLSEVA
jgi:hypothetical protein